MCFVKWNQMTGSYVAQCSVCYSRFGPHLKLNDLNSISCLLSMRLCRHANNRKFALTGIDQQPFIVSHDSEVSHDSSASDRIVRQAFISCSGTPGYLLGCRFIRWVTAGVEINWRWKFHCSYKDCGQNDYIRVKIELPVPWVTCLCLTRSHSTREKSRQQSHTVLMSNTHMTPLYQSATTGHSHRATSLWGL